MKTLYLFSILAVLVSFNGYSQSTASKQVDSFSINAPQLDTLKKIWIYLPHSYSTSNKKYPVVYMHDGQNLFDRETSYVGEWGVDESLDSIGEKEAIVVGIEHGGDKRIEELTPFPHEKYGGGNANAYIDFIVEDLKPYIDSHYRTLPGAEHTGIFGSSLGGLVSFYAALKHADIFGKVGVYSPSFWFSRKIYDFAAEQELNPKTRFYFLAGTAESENMVSDLEEMIGLLKKKGLDPKNFEVKYVEDGEHNEAMWGEHFPQSFLWLMQ